MDQIVRSEKTASPPSIDEALSLGPNGPGKRERRRWPYVLLVFVALAAIAGWYVWNGQAATRMVYATAPAETGDLTVEVSATGTLEPLTQVDISSELSGIVRAVRVEENQNVTAGQILAQLDRTRLAAQVERAEASVQAARANVSEAEVTLGESEQALSRTSRLGERGMVSDQALEAARATRDRAASGVDSARANLAIAQADMKLQEADLANTTIVAPIDGIVLLRDVDPGQTVASSLQAPILFTIAENLERMELKAAIDEADIGTVAVGQKARFTVDAFPDQRFAAEISDISYASVNTEGVVTYEALLSVDNADLVLRPGMTATVSVITREAQNVVTVPTEALRFTPPAAAEEGRGFGLQALFNPRMRGRGRRGGRGDRDGESAGARGQTVYVMENGQPARRGIETGATNGDRTEIVSGLEAGEIVVVQASQRGG